MFSTLRNRFGIPGVISVIALVFALVGGAFAANNLGGSGKGATASAKKKAVKGPRGPRGATGPAGPVGAAGPKGDAGAAGANGADGVKGATGGTGANGKSVATGTLSPGQGGCSEGGAYVEVAGEAATKKSICNGEEGAAGNGGTDGEPWVVGQAPSGVTMKGTWSVQPYNAAAANEFIAVPFSTGVPIGGPVFPAVVPPGPADPNHGGGCTGTAAQPVSNNTGIMCIYQQEAVNLNTPLALSLSSSGGGGVLRFKTLAVGMTSAYGSWALKTP